MADTVQQIKDKLSIVDVVQPYVKLTRAGKYWKGLSPFNKEKTPSFFVSPDRGLYHCFSTGKGGDMFTFIEEMESVDFRGALKILAEKAGVELVYERPEVRDEKERLYAAVEAAKDFFKETLGKREDVKGYLTTRGLTKETISTFEIGYAEGDWQGLHAHLTKKGFTEAELERAGLIKKGEKEEGLRVPRFYDRFRGRVMFPIHDTSGRAIAFSGRIFEDDEKNPQAKYLNSPETPLFDKSVALFGLEKAKEGIRSLNSAILVEGQFDLLMAHQAGYTNTVATSGTAFSDRHAKVVARYTPNLLIAYDGDRAGIAAAGRAASVALPAGMNVKIAKLPPDKDPADLVANDLASFKEMIKGALHVVDFYLAHITDAKYDARTYKLEVTRVVLPYIAMIPNTIDQSHFIQRVADALHVSEEAIIAELKKVQTSKISSAEEAVAEPFLSRGDTIERLIWGLMTTFKERGEEKEAAHAEEILRKATTPAHYERLEASLASDKRAALFEADFFLERNTGDALPSALEELFGNLNRESSHERYREALRELRAAEAQKDSKRAETLMQNLQTLASSLK